MAIRRFSSSSLTTGSKSSKLWDQETSLGYYESIATATVDSSGASSITFSNIPQNYLHLQLRGLIKYTSTSNDRSAITVRFNSDSNNNYSRHEIYATGANVYPDAATSSNAGRITSVTAPSSHSNYTNIFGVFIGDILDYSSTSKNKTSRGLGGFDANGVSLQNISFCSTSWYNSSTAITSITLTPDSNNWAQYTQVALYGIRGA